MTQTTSSPAPGTTRPKGITRTVTASPYGGPADPQTGSTGYKGDNLYQHPDTFGELSTNYSAAPNALDYSALGNLPYLTPITVTNTLNNKSLTLYKRDVGAGGPGIGGYPRAIDIWFASAAKLGMTGLTVVKVDIGVTGGGTSGLGGTGTPANAPTPSLWTVGSPTNPDQDYWTTINQYAMDAQWYCFSDGEQLVVGDGFKLMQQQPAAVIHRLDPKLIHAECIYDNTAFAYASSHHRKGRIQRRTALARVTSPTEVILSYVCDIDQFRAGDVVQLALFGPADGPWLIGDCTRNVFQPHSELTLVQAMQPINASSGLQTGPSFLQGAQATTQTGTVMHALVSAAATINNDNLPYVYAGGHGSAGTPSVGSPGGNGYDGHTIGFDCSGAVAAVLVAGGLWQKGTSVPADSGIIQQLLAAHTIVPGQGTGRPECTLFDYPGQHIFMRLNGEYWGTESGQLSGPGSVVPQSAGGGWMPNGNAGSAIPYHVPASILGQQAAA